jgi:methyl-accepting chemotaxis protein
MSSHVKGIMETRDRSSARTFRRRHYFIDRSFQGAFVLRFVVATLLAAVVAGWLLYRGMQADLEAHMYSAHVRLASTGELVLNRLIPTEAAMGAVLLVVAIALVVRIERGCGFAFRRARAGFERVAQGDLTVEMWAKSKDHLDGLFSEINATIAHARSCTAEAHEALATVEAASAAGQARDPVVVLRLRECAAALRKIGPSQP